MEAIIEKKKKQINKLANSLGFKSTIGKYWVKFSGKKTNIRLILYAGLEDEIPEMYFYNDRLIMNTFKAKDKDINDFANDIINAVKLKKKVLKIVSE